MMNIFLGVDAGGTKTRAKLINSENQILGEGHGGGANPHNQDLEKVLSNVGLAVLTAVKQAEGKLGHNIQHLDGTCIGMAGLDTQADRDLVSSGLKAGMMKTWCSQNGLLLVNDGFIGLRSGTDENFGICIISGTGSNVYGISRDGTQAQAGDWGFILGDGGSGFAMGQELLREAMKEYDGRSSKSILSEKILNHLNFSDHVEMIRWVYGDGVPVRDIAGLTRLFEDSEFSQMQIVARVVDRAVEYQRSAFQAVVKKLGLENQLFTTVLAGGLMNLGSVHYPQKLQSTINSCCPTANAIIQAKQPVEGALALAHEMYLKPEISIFQNFFVEWE